MKRDLTSGSIIKNLLVFSIPYLFSCFLQTFYGLADLFITGLFNGSESITGVSVGSQLMHMLTVIIAGFAMGSTVTIAGSIGAGQERLTGKSIGNTVTIFTIFAVAATGILVLLRWPVINLLSTPQEALSETGSYVLICFLGIPFITAYNVISSIFRGLGDTVSPLVFIGIAGVVNIILDYVLIGPLHMGAAGAAIATVAAQAISVILSIVFILKKETGIKVCLSDLRPERAVVRHILQVGIPIAAQDGFVQVAFLVITAIANARGLEVAAAVGIVEKVISFLFLVPSAMLSTVSAIGAQNAGAGKHDRSIRTLKSAIMICLVYGAIATILCELIPGSILGVFSREGMVIVLGIQYLRSYAFDTLIAGIHFCFCGFFSAYNRSIYSFVSNLASILLVRIPGAWLASRLFPATLLSMGMAAPLGSLLSSAVSLFLFIYMQKNGKIRNAVI